MREHPIFVKRLFVLLTACSLFLVLSSSFLQQSFLLPQNLNFASLHLQNWDAPIYDLLMMN